MNILEKLQRIDRICNKYELQYFLREILGNRMMYHEDAKLLMLQNYKGFGVSFTDNIITFLAFIGFIDITKDRKVYIIEKYMPTLANDDKLMEQIILLSIEKLFEFEIFSPELFFYNVNQKYLRFENHLLPLSFAAIRKLLVSMNLFDIINDGLYEIFRVNKKYERDLLKLIKPCTEIKSLKTLLKELENKQIAGSQAEDFVLEYEKNRLAKKSNDIIKISDINVCAGYDICSYETNRSKDYDRFIEVKAVSESYGFYWSSNEMNIARQKGDEYFLYLIDLNKIKNEGYKPYIIKNPANLFPSRKWLMEPCNYYIHSLEDIS